ncbi:MAG: DUF1697 domain-containing protein [Nocardioidaceae bacterium]|nr:DUF1697 domain-containing protein [Nocardioidaceae bacterium]MCL2613450.1 DUF1697 domain-containing protein [Nocardioidaceae bacterium]
MPTYVAFLRAINLGATRKFAKADIAAATEAAGGEGVETYINTGNVRLASSMRSSDRVRGALERAYAERTGFEVPTIVFRSAELVAVADDTLELATPDLERHYVFLLQAEPEPAAVAALESRSEGGRRVVVRNRAAHLLLGPGYEQGNVDPWGVEKGLGVVGTNRNANVVRTVAERWCR